MVDTDSWFLCLSHIYYVKKNSSQNIEGLILYENKKLNKLTST